MDYNNDIEVRKISGASTRLNAPGVIEKPLTEIQQEVTNMQNQAHDIRSLVKDIIKKLEPITRMEEPTPKNRKDLPPTNTILGGALREVHTLSEESYLDLCSLYQRIEI